MGLREITNSELLQSATYALRQSSWEDFGPSLRTPRGRSPRGQIMHKLCVWMFLAPVEKQSSVPSPIVCSLLWQLERCPLFFLSLVTGDTDSVTLLIPLGIWY